MYIHVQWKWSKREGERVGWRKRASAMLPYRDTLSRAREGDGEIKSKDRQRARTSVCVFALRSLSLSLVQDQSTTLAAVHNV